MTGTASETCQFVYCLEDETGTPFYVGCAHDVQRPEGHIKNARNEITYGQIEKNKIIIRMLDAGMRPYIRVIQKGPSHDAGYNLEREMIAKKATAH